VDNGSVDSSPDLIRRIVEKWPNCVRVHLMKPDIGEALKAGLEKAQGRWAYIINVDFWDHVFLRWTWRNRERYDLVLGSKQADLSLNRQSCFRRILSWGLNVLLQLFFGFVGTDTHGQKFLNISTLRPIIKQCVMRRGQFDTEFTLRAMYEGLSLAEVPVPIRELRPKRNPMIKKIIQNFLDLPKLRSAIHPISSKRTIHYHRLTRSDIER